MSGRVLRGVALGLLVAVVAFALLVLRAVTSGQEELLASNRAWDEGQVVEALGRARRAATHYAPGAPHVRHAYERMFAVAHGAERRGDLDLAERAWADVRGAALETRHLGVAHASRLSEADQNLSRLARIRVAGKNELGAPGPSGEGETGAEGGRPGLGSPWWGLGLFAGFCAMAFGLATCVVRGVLPDGGIRPEVFRLGGLLVAVGAACWTLVVLWA